VLELFGSPYALLSCSETRELLLALTSTPKNPGVKFTFNRVIVHNVKARIKITPRNKKIPSSSGEGDIKIVEDVNLTETFINKFFLSTSMMYLKNHE